ncbi:MAG: permease prefix domain 1-containing protein [Lachnospirales bacterium]
MYKNSRIENYVDSIFKTIPTSISAIELKEELTTNMNERYEDYLNKGFSKQQAYKETIHMLGDVNELLKEVIPTDTFLMEVDKYRKRNSILEAVATGMYIVCAIPAILFGALGVPFLLILVAIATGILIYADASVPIDIKKYIEKIDK